jgi:hypothetical protein
VAVFAMTWLEVAAVQRAHQEQSTPSNAKLLNLICVFHVHVIAQYIVFVNSTSHSLDQIPHSIVGFKQCEISMSMNFF